MTSKYDDGCGKLFILQFCTHVAPSIFCFLRKVVEHVATRQHNDSAAIWTLSVCPLGIAAIHDARYFFVFCYSKISLLQANTATHCFSGIHVQTA